MTVAIACTVAGAVLVLAGLAFGAVLAFGLLAGAAVSSVILGAALLGVGLFVDVDRKKRRR